MIQASLAKGGTVWIAPAQVEAVEDSTASRCFVYAGEEAYHIDMSGSAFVALVTATTGGSSGPPYGSSGFIDYNDTSTQSTPLSLIDGQWQALPNDGLGAFTNKAYAPTNVTELMITPQGLLDFTDLDLGDAVFIRHDFEVTPDVDLSTLDLRYELGTGAASYTLERNVGQLARGAGIGYRQTALVDFIYMGDTNTRDNPVTVSVRLTGADGSCVNYGCVIEVVKA